MTVVLEWALRASFVSQLSLQSLLYPMRLDSRHLDDRSSKIAADQGESALRTERLGATTQYVLVQRRRRRFPPCQAGIAKNRLAVEIAEPLAGH